MIIPSQLPQIVTAARSGALQALALQAGQILDGRVIGPAPNGGTQVQISGQLLNLILPQAAKTGETLRFEVQGSGAQVRLALQAASAKPPLAAPPTSAAAQSTASTPGPAASASTAPSPATQPQAASAPQAGGPAVNPTTTPATPPAAALPAPAAAPPPPAGAPIPAAPQAATASTAASAPAAAPLAQRASSAPPVLPAATGPVVASVAGTATSTTVTTSVPSGQTAPRSAVPYAQSLPANPAVPGAPATAANAAAATAGIRTTGTVAQPNAVAAPIAAAPPTVPGTPQAALAQMVQRALPQQNSMANLTAALTDIVGKIALPEPVARAAQQVLANQVTIQGGKLDGGTLQKAVLNSGLFQEAALTRPGTPLLAPQTDMKAAMLALRQTLTTWLGQQPPLVAALSQIAPPLRGKFPRVSSPDIPPIDPSAGADEIGKHLLDRTESALSRIRLHQHASLPDPNVKGADWSTDLPVVIGGHQTLLQLQIHRDQHNPGEEAGERGWQMRFGINLPGLGEVGAQVSLRGSATGVMLWAAERSTSEALEADIEGLRDGLTGAGLAPGAVIVRHGAPPASQLPANAGHLVDSRR